MEQYNHQRSSLLSILSPVTSIYMTVQRGPLGLSPTISAVFLSFALPFLSLSPLQLVYSPLVSSSHLVSVAYNGEPRQRSFHVRVQRGLSADPAPRVELKIRVVPHGLPTPSRNSIGDEMKAKEQQQEEKYADGGKEKKTKGDTRFPQLCTLVVISVQRTSVVVRVSLVEIHSICIFKVVIGIKIFKFQRTLPPFYL